jgi:4a-hydroxytetrahydrobiopterin dehydratase
MMNAWLESDNKLYKTFEFADFNQAFAFMTEVAKEAELVNHHPDWRNVWNKVFITLNTHDAGDIVTAKDRDLAQRIDQLFLNYTH